MSFKKPRRLSIIIPVFNEQSTVRKVISQVYRADSCGLKKEVIIIDDGSWDQTPRLLEKEKFRGLNIISHKKNRGKGWAIRNGLKSATGDIILIQDADLEYSPKDYPKLLAPFLKDAALVVYGSRELSGENHHSYLSFHAGGKMVTILTNLLYGSNLTDVPTGYKLFRKEVLNKLPLRCKRFEFCPEVTARILKNKIPIIEVPIGYNARTREEGKKIKARDGIEAFWTLVRYKFPWKPARILKKQPFGKNNESFLDVFIKKIRLGKITRYMPKNSLVVDLGCGYKGYFLNKIARNINRGIGFDLEVNNDGLPPNITLKTASVDQELPLADNMADVVTALAIVEHLNNPQILYKEALRVLKPNGTLIITTPSSKSKRLLEFMAFKLKIISSQEISDHKRYYNFGKIQQELMEAGFQKDRIETSLFEMGLNMFVKAAK